MKVCESDARLVYAVLQVRDVSELKLFDGEALLYDFVLRRKECLIQESPEVLGIKI